MGEDSVDILHSEVVRPLGVEKIGPINPVVEFLPIRRNKEGRPDLSVFLVGADRGQSDRLKRAGLWKEVSTLLPFKASGTSGRTVMFEVEWDSPGINVEGGNVVLDLEQRIIWEGVDIKGGGSTLEGWMNRSPGWLSLSRIGVRRLRSGGLLGNKDQLDIGPSGQGDLIGSCDYHHCLGEYEDTMLMIAAGARAPLPLFVAKLSKEDVGYGSRVEAGMELGVIVRAYRSPFTWAEMVDTRPSEPERVQSMIRSASNYLVKEGLLDRKEINETIDTDPVVESQKLARLYLLTGAKIMGEDLSKIHIVRSIGNRNLQNTSTVFEHRDLWDGVDLAKVWNRAREPITKFQDVVWELRNFQTMATYLDPDHSEENSRDACKEYMLSYLKSERGLTKKQFGLLLLNHTIVSFIFDAGFSSLFNFSLEPIRELGRLGEIYKEVIRELEGGM